MTENACETFFGKYRGKVEKNLDPLGLGRVQVSVADALGDGGLAWAMPCFPGAGPKVGLFDIPPQGANVWVEFERGDPDYPIYSGGFWDVGDAPSALPSTKVWAGNDFSIEIASVPNTSGLAVFSLSISTATGVAEIKADGTVMSLSFAGNTVSLDAKSVTINNGNLMVLP